MTGPVDPVVMMRKLKLPSDEETTRNDDGTRPSTTSTHRRRVEERSSGSERSSPTRRNRNKVGRESIHSTIAEIDTRFQHLRKVTYRKGSDSHGDQALNSASPASQRVTATEPATTNPQKKKRGMGLTNEAVDSWGVWLNADGRIAEVAKPLTTPCTDTLRMPARPSFSLNAAAPLITENCEFDKFAEDFDPTCDPPTETSSELGASSIHTTMSSSALSPRRRSKQTLEMQNADWQRECMSANATKPKGVKGVLTDASGKSWLIDSHGNKLRSCTPANLAPPPKSKFPPRPRVAIAPPTRPGLAPRVSTNRLEQEWDPSFDFSQVTIAESSSRRSSPTKSSMVNRYSTNQVRPKSALPKLRAPEQVPTRSCVTPQPFPSNPFPEPLSPTLLTRARSDDLAPIAPARNKVSPRTNRSPTRRLDLSPPAKTSPQLPVRTTWPPPQQAKKPVLPSLSTSRRVIRSPTNSPKATKTVPREAPPVPLPLPPSRGPARPPRGNSKPIVRKLMPGLFWQQKGHTSLRSVCSSAQSVQSCDTLDESITTTTTNASTEGQLTTGPIAAAQLRMPETQDESLRVLQVEF